MKVFLKHHFSFFFHTYFFLPIFLLFVLASGNIFEEHIVILIISGYTLNTHVLAFVTHRPIKYFIKVTIIRHIHIHTLKK